MNRLDKEIMMALLGSQQSMYGLEKSLKDTNYATVWRHVKRMQKDHLLSTTKVARKNGKQDERGTQKPELTTKGLATLIIDGDLQKKELLIVGRKVLQNDYSDLPATFLRDTKVDEIFANTLLKMRHKINLKFFNGKHFDETFDISFAESLFENLPKFNFQRTSKTKAGVQKLRSKYIAPQTVKNLRNLHKRFIQERNKYSHYAKVIGGFLQVLSKGRD